MRCSSRNPHLRFTPRSSSLASHAQASRPTSFIFKRIFIILGSIVLLYVFFTTFHAHGHADVTVALQQQLQLHLDSQEGKEIPTFYDPHLQKSDLRMELSTSTTNESVLIVTVTNFHPQTTVELLRWDSPFDADALSRCVYKVTDSATGKLVPCTEKKIEREKPPKSSDFIEVAPHHAVTIEARLGADPDGSGVALEPGRNYEFKVKKRYKGVWKADVRKVDRLYLGRTGGGSGMVDWEYETNVARIKAM